jgi:hypothetical protein
VSNWQVRKPKRRLKALNSAFLRGKRVGQSGILFACSTNGGMGNKGEDIITGRLENGL